MKITDIEIRNFRSIRHVKLENLGNIVILIGQNGSGKSNILEGLELFFADLNLLTDVEKQARADLWFDKRTDVPIDISVTIELENTSAGDDLDSIFSDEILAQLKLGAPPKAGRKLTIRRQISGKVWKNVDVRLEGVFHTKGDKIYLSKVVSELRNIKADGGDLVSEGVQVLAETPIEPGAAQALLKRLTDEFKNEFKLIRGPREATERPAAPARAAILDAESKAFFTALALERDRVKEEQWNQYSDEFERFSKRRLQVRGTEIEFRERDLALPLELSGSGDQALLILMRQLNQNAWFYAIEEPETRLHHDYIRKLFKYLQKESEAYQIFVSTHSPVFVDKAFLGNTWLVRLRNKQTDVTRLENDGLRDVLLDLGIRPSDFFFANQVLFVEGRSEEIFVPLLADKAGMDFTNVKLMPLRGKSRSHYHLTVWLQAAQDTGIPSYLLLDKNANAEAEEAINSRLIDRDNCMVLAKDSLVDSAECDIEDFYPRDLLMAGLQKICPAIDWAKIPINDPEKPVVSLIVSATKSQAWKAKLAEYVGTMLTPQHIENELRDVVRFMRRIPNTGVPELAVF